MVDFIINTQLEKLFPGMPGISRFLADSGPPNGGNPQKCENGRFHNKHSIRNAVSRNAWNFQVFGCPSSPDTGEPTFPECLEFLGGQQAGPGQPGGRHGPFRGEARQEGQTGQEGREGMRAVKGH